MQVFCRFISFAIVVNAASCAVHGIPCTRLDEEPFAPIQVQESRIMQA